LGRRMRHSAVYGDMARVRELLHMGAAVDARDPHSAAYAHQHNMSVTPGPAFGSVLYWVLRSGDEALAIEMMEEPYHALSSESNVELEAILELLCSKPKFAETTIAKVLDAHEAKQIFSVDTMSRALHGAIDTARCLASIRLIRMGARVDGINSKQREIIKEMVFQDFLKNACTDAHHTSTHVHHSTPSSLHHTAHTGHCGTTAAHGHAHAPAAAQTHGHGHAHAHAAPAAHAAAHTGATDVQHATAQVKNMAL
jgi:hypothetical protein